MMKGIFGIKLFPSPHSLPHLFLLNFAQTIRTIRTCSRVSINQPIGNYAVVMAQVISKVWCPPPSPVSIYMSSISHFRNYLLNEKWDLELICPHCRIDFMSTSKRTDIDSFEFFSSSLNRIYYSLFFFVCVFRFNALPRYS